MTRIYTLNADALQGSYRPLYNGNISSMAVSIGKFGNLPLLYNYKYDRLNRLTQMDTWKGFNASANNWSGVQPTDDYKERIAYDGNGNILRYLRNTQNQSQPMDSMRYEYYAGTNRLSHIVDRAPAWIEGIKDIETQPTNNYQYDAIGNLTGDISENIADGGIEWNVYGKITSITKSSAVSGNDTRQIRYNYDASGNRIGKKVTKFGSAEVEYTWYVRDASGNVLAVYTAKKDTTGDPGLSEFDLTLSEQDVYGSSRLGVRQLSEGVEGSLPAVSIYQHWLGQRRYELGNHLGNILATISDRKTGVADITDGSLTDHYLADVVSAQDYYPFGMLMPGRTFEASEYRYGFNGKENDNDVKGEGNQQDYGMRIYDMRVGRFLSVDPIGKKYPMLSTYQFAGNSPIRYIDLDGLEPSEPGKRRGEVQTGTNGNDLSKSWKWDGKEWQDNNSLEEVIVTAKLNKPTDDEKMAINNSSIPFPEENWVARRYNVGLNKIFDEFKNTYGPVNSVFLDNHPLTKSVKEDIKEVDRLRFLAYKKYEGRFPKGGSYTRFAAYGGSFLPWNDNLSITPQFIGTFSGDVFVTEDGKNLVFVITDSKSATSFFYRIVDSHNRDWNDGSYYGNTFQKYIWTEPISDQYYDFQKSMRDANGNFKIPFRPSK